MTPDVIHHPGVVTGTAAAVSGTFAMIGTFLSVANPILQGAAYAVSITVGVIAIIRASRK